MRAFLIAAALFAAAPAFAQNSTTTALTLADATAAPSRTTVIDGAAWRCEGATCTATGGASQPASRACRRAVARFGAVTAFTYKGATLSDADLATCNAG